MTLFDMCMLALLANMRKMLEYILVAVIVHHIMMGPVGA